MAASQLTPLFLESERGVSSEAQEAFLSERPRLREKYPCVAYWTLGVDADEPICGGLDFLPDAETLAGLRRDLEALIGPVRILEMHYDVAAGKAYGRLITGS